MQIGKAAMLVAAIALLGSCIKPYNPTEPATPCASTSCQVNVTITYQKSPFKCNIDVVPQSLNVSGGQSPKTITWTFTVNGDALPLPPIPIKFDSNAEGVISNLTLVDSSVTGTYTRPNTSGNHYGYGVSIITKLCSIDPWVVD